MKCAKCVLISIALFLLSGCSTFDVDPENGFPPIEYDSDVEYTG